MKSEWVAGLNRNPQSAVHRPSFYDPETNPTYGRMADHYDVGVLPAPAAQLGGNTHCCRHARPPMIKEIVKIGVKTWAMNGIFATDHA